MIYGQYTDNIFHGLFNTGAGNIRITRLMIILGMVLSFLLWLIYYVCYYMELWYNIHILLINLFININI